VPVTIAGRAALGRLEAAASARPTAVDAGAAALLYIALTFGVATAGELSRPHGQAIGAVVNVVLVGPLAWRRRAPLAVLAVTGVASVASGLLLRATGGEAAVLVALATVVAREARWRVSLAAVALTVAAAGVVALGLGARLDQLAGVAAALTASVAVGVAVRTRRAQLAERAAELARDRAFRAEIAAAAERARIARELHDVVAHNISVIIALADGGGLSVRSEPERALEALEGVASTGREALRELRGLVGVLREDDAGPEAGRRPQPGVGELDELVARVRLAGLPVRLRVEGEPTALGAGLELTIYRVAQEALTNTLRHAREAQGAEVRLRYGAEAVELEVLDDGRRPAARAGAGRGLLGMRERAGAHGASLQAGPRNGGGWRVAMRLPRRPTGAGG
jgi:signal transduction histidine kinase